MKNFMHVSFVLADGESLCNVPKIYHVEGMKAFNRKASASVRMEKEVV